MAECQGEAIFRPSKTTTASHQIWLVFAVNLQMLLSGYGIGFSAPCISQLVTEDILTSEELSWFPGSLVLGQVLGILLGPLLADLAGRRTTCLFAAVASFASWLFLSTSQLGWALLLARTLTGFADSLVMPVGILYISEVAETKLRGTFLNTTGLAFSLGIAVAYLVGGATSWRLAGLVPSVVCCIATPILFIMKESPVYLVKKRKDALGALRWYRTEGEGEEARSLLLEELHGMENKLAGTSLSFSQALVKLLNRENRKPFFILMVLFAVNPLTGVYSITFFAISLFEKLGLGSLQAVAVTSALARVFGTALSSLLMHRLGRRALYIPACAVSTLAMALIGGLMSLRRTDLEMDDGMISWAMVLFIFLFMFSFGVAISSFPWVLMGEWFPADLSALVTGILITTQFAFIFIAVQLTGPLMSLFGPDGIFLYFASVSALNTAFVVIMVPETHGETFSHFQTRESSQKLLTIQRI